MGWTCHVQDCPNKHLYQGNKSQALQISYHTCPDIPAVRREWLKFLKRPPDWKPPKRIVVCSSHFKKEDLQRWALRELGKRSIPSVRHHVNVDVGVKLDANQPIVPGLSRLDHTYARPAVPTTTELMTTPVRGELLDNNLQGGSTDLPKGDAATDVGKDSSNSSRQSKSIYEPPIYDATPIACPGPQRKNVKRALIDSPQRTPKKKKRRMTLADISTPNPEDTPRRRKLKKHVSLKSTKVQKMRKRSMTLHQQIKRMKTIIATQCTTIEQLKSEITALQMKVKTQSNVPSVIAAALERSNKKNQQVPPALRKFSISLHYLSPRAYEFVRKELNYGLPTARTMALWFESIEGSPGFLKESLHALKVKQESSDFPLVCSLIVDEMAVRQDAQWVGDGFLGFTDLGGVVESNKPGETVAKEAYVFLLNCINSNWKIPVAYFFVAGLNSDQRAGLVKQCLSWLETSGVRVVSVTCDAPNSNWGMGKLLGCSFEPDNLQTSFPHPEDSSNVFFIFDACHMIKLVRNCFGDKRVLVDGEGREIKWAYVEKLYELQQHEGLHAGNKLKLRHLEYKKQIMKVNLAVQLLSSSVANALEFCLKLKLADFEGVQATVDFIRLFNNLFDVLNSKNIRQIGFKKPMFETNYQEVFQFLEMASNYIKGLKLNGVPVVQGPRKAGFLGFLVTAQSVKSMYIELVQKHKLLSYLPTYKISQDHLEMFFGHLRHRGGHNNNPTCSQIIAAMKRVTVQKELQIGMKGNCTPQEEFNILTISSHKAKTPIETINDSCIENRYYTNDELKEVMLSADAMDDHDYALLSSLVGHMSEYTEEVVGYVSGFVSRRLSSKIKCQTCVASLTASPGEFMTGNVLISTKNRGGLVTPSDDVFATCKVVEKLLK